MPHPFTARRSGGHRCSRRQTFTNRPHKIGAKRRRRCFDKLCTPFKRVLSAPFFAPCFRSLILPLTAFRRQRLFVALFRGSDVSVCLCGVSTLALPSSLSLSRLILLSLCLAVCVGLASTSWPHSHACSDSGVQCVCHRRMSGTTATITHFFARL